MPSALDRAISSLHETDRRADARAASDRVGAPARLLVCVAFLVAITACKPHDLAGVLLLAIHPVALCILDGPPPLRLLRRAAPFIPIALALGLPSVFIDHAPAFAVGRVTVTRGALLAATLALKGILCILAAAQLGGFCGLERIVGAMRKFGLPGRAATTMLLSARHLIMMLQEVSRMAQAYALRAPGRRGVAFRDWGPFAGNLLLRSIDRAETVHEAMLLRGFRESDPALPPIPRLSAASVAFAAFWIAAFVAASFARIPAL